MTRALGWVLAIFLGAIVLQIDRLPALFTAAAIAIAAWRCIAALYGLALPGRIARLLIGTSLLAAVILQYRTLNGLAAGTALLSAMGAAKLLETRARRDQYVMWGVSLFIMLAACLDRPSLPRTPLYIAHLWMCWSALAIIATPNAPLSIRAATAMAGRALLLSVPLALLLFLLFPRIQGQIWSLATSQGAVTGLSDEMSPGAISQLSESDEPAFRVRFLGPTPPAVDRYWRGPVLHEFDGYTWRRQPYDTQRSAPSEFEGTAYRYRITLEPHQHYWWFALDVPRAAPSDDVHLTSDYQLLTSQPVSQAVTYTAISYTRVRQITPLSDLARQMGTRLAGNRNPRSRALAQQLRAAAGSDAEFMRTVLQRFAAEGFEYTLTPPKLDLDSVDDFMFNTKRGFCGHFASAFTMLMRAGNVPARIVTGYQGGEWNPIGNYYIVRQSDAHAWSEVWLDGSGWTRVDPTAMAAPERLRRGDFELLANTAGALNAALQQLSWPMRARLAWDAANTWWHDAVLKFDMSAQLRLLERLGVKSPDLRDLTLTLCGGFILWLLWILWRFQRERPLHQPDSLTIAYRRLCGQLQDIGLAREPHEGPETYAARLTHSRPDLGAQIIPLLQSYAALRYEPGPEPDQVKQFRRSIDALHLAKS